MWIFACLFSTVVLTTAAAQSCPANQIASDVQIVQHGDGLIPASAARLPGGDPDPSLRFFSKVLGYSDDQIQQEVQNALQFFSERFGLDFSLTQPNEEGLRFFQNATLRPIRRFNIVFTTLNRWILTGNTRTKCFSNPIGGFIVTFTGEQILKGTYGGEDGIDVLNDRNLAYEYMTISVPPCEPIVIQRRTPIPIEAARIGIYVTFYELSHPTLGQGAQQGVVQLGLVTAANGTAFVQLSGSSVFTFPPNVLSFTDDR